MKGLHPTRDASGNVIGYECDIRRVGKPRVHRRWRFAEGYTKEQIEEEFTGLRKKHRRGVAIDDGVDRNPTLADFAPYYLDQCKPNPQGGGNSAAWHERKTRIMPALIGYFGPMRMSEIDRAEVITFREKMEGAGFNSKTVNLYVGVVSNMFTVAMDLSRGADTRRSPHSKVPFEFRITENPVTGLDPLPWRKPDPRLLKPAEDVELFRFLLDGRAWPPTPGERWEDARPPVAKIVRRSVVIGARFGRLAIQRLYRVGYHHYAECRCDCGTPKGIRVESLRSGWSRSCGCVLRLSPKDRPRKETSSVGRRRAIRAQVPIYYILNRDTPSRTRDLLTLDWTSVFLERNCIVFPPRKGKKTHAVPLTEDARRALEALPHREGLVFLGRAVYEGMIRRIQAFGLQGLRPHDLRHTLAVDFIEAGGSTDALTRLFGWSDPKMASYYTTLAAKHLAPQMRQLDEHRQLQRGSGGTSGGTSEGFVGINGDSEGLSGHTRDQSESSQVDEK